VFKGYVRSGDFSPETFPSLCADFLLQPSGPTLVCRNKRTVATIVYCNPTHQCFIEVKTHLYIYNFIYLTFPVPVSNIFGLTGASALIELRMLSSSLICACQLP
jgi:hypothetical protein